MKRENGLEELTLGNCARDANAGGGNADVDEFGFLFQVVQKYENAFVSRGSFNHSVCVGNQGRERKHNACGYFRQQRAIFSAQYSTYCALNPVRSFRIGQSFLTPP